MKVMVVTFIGSFVLGGFTSLMMVRRSLRDLGRIDYEQWT